MQHIHNNANRLQIKEQARALLRTKQFVVIGYMEHTQFELPILFSMNLFDQLLNKVNMLLRKQAQSSRHKIALFVVFVPAIK